jgi:uncharacterized membrane protein YjfL (UPF0719 family)
VNACCLIIAPEDLPSGLGPALTRRGESLDFTNYLISILISLIVGLVGFIAAYKVFDWLTPGVNFSDQLNADNRSVAIFLAGLFIGLGLLLGNAIK